MILDANELTRLISKECQHLERVEQIVIESVYVCIQTIGVGKKLRTLDLRTRVGINEHVVMSALTQ